MGKGNCVINLNKISVKDDLDNRPGRQVNKKIYEKGE